MAWVNDFLFYLLVYNFKPHGSWKVNKYFIRKFENSQKLCFLAKFVYVANVKCSKDITLVWNIYRYIELENSQKLWLLAKFTNVSKTKLFLEQQSCKTCLVKTAIWFLKTCQLFQRHQNAKIFQLKIKIGLKTDILDFVKLTFWIL